ncbi:GAF and ANTAR domain-containing protein [Rhodococcoides trifolii]|nr:GAF and ANTAR domain-containing protein [Rhodococcus trifolii]
MTEDGPKDHRPEVDDVARDDDLQTALAGLAQLSMGSQALPDMLTHVADFAVKAIPHADGAGLTLMHDARPDTVVSSASFVREVDEIQYRIEEGPCISAAATAETVRSGSLGGDKRFPHFGPRVGRLGVHSALSLPLITRDTVIGALNVYSKSKDAFDDGAVTLGEMFAFPAAVSVMNAQALADAVHLAQQLEKALHSRSDIDQAIGILIGRTGCSQTEAFDKLRAMSQRENRKLKDVAIGLVEEAARRARARSTDS